MAILVMVLSPDGTEGSCIQLEPQSYCLGRSQDADIELDSSTVSREHAKLYPTGGRWHLEDTNSRNGISLNGRRVENAVLQEGDLFGIGPMNVFFFTECSPEELEALGENFHRLKEMALKYILELAASSKPLMDPSEKIPLIKARSSAAGLGKNLTLLSDIASGKLREGV